MAAKAKRDWGGAAEKKFLRLLEQGHSLKEIARVLACHTSTLARHYGEFIEAHRSGRLGQMWTEEQRGMVQAMSGFGLPQEQVAIVMGISEDVLKAHFVEELRQGIPIANAQVASWLFGACRNGDVTAMKYWLSRRAGWVETLSVRGKIEHEHTGIPDAPDAREALRTLDDDGRQSLRHALEQLGASSAVAEGPTEQDTVH